MGTEKINIASIRSNIDEANKSIALRSDNTGNVIHVTYIETGLGTMVAAATDKGICMLEFPDYKHLLLEFKQLVSYFKTTLEERDSPHFHTLQKQMDEYFDGKRKAFDIPLDMVGTDFQKTAWEALLTIPYGTTSSYGELANSLGKSTSARAIANANGKNKIAIIIPCHRIIGADGSLTGYAGGLERKEKLLDLEQQHLSQK